MSVLPVYMCIVCMPGALTGQQRVLDPPRTGIGVTEDYELLFGCRKRDPSLLEEQPGLLNWWAISLALAPDFKLLVSVNGPLTRLSCLMATVSLSENKAMFSVLYTHIFTAFTCYASVPISGTKSILQICGVIKSIYIKSPILRFI